jgi:drug/metabolite transporter (DMT)-like permease
MATTTLAEVTAELVGLEDPKAREVNARHGDDHGVHLGALRALAKRLKTQVASAGWALTVVAAAASWSVGSFLSGRIRMPADPFVATVYEMVAGALVLAVVAAARGELADFHPAAVSTRSWLALGYLMVAGSLVAFTAYVWLLQKAPISLVSTYAYVNPAVAVALGALLVAEPITPQVLLGGAVIVAGVALVVTTERPRRAGTGSRSGDTPVRDRQ